MPVRPAREIMAELATTGMTPDQIALVMELSAAVSAEARPVVDEAAARRRERDKEYQAQKRAERRQISADSYDVTDEPLSRPPNENNLTPPTHTPENNTPRAKADPFPKPDGIEPALWADFLKNRKTKKLTNTATAHAGVLSDLANLSARTGWPPGKVLAACVAKGWGAIYETDEMKEVTVGKPRQRNAPASTLDAVQRAIELTGGASERGPSGPATVDSRAGALPHAVRAIGHVQ